MNIKDIPKPYTAQKMRWSSLFGRGGRFGIYYFDTKINELINLNSGEANLIVEMMNAAYQVGVIDTLGKQQ